MIRSALRTRVMKWADADGSGRWDTTAGAAGEVDMHIGVAFDREWRGILNVNRFYRFAERNPVPDANGRVAISDLTQGSGDSVERFYRVLALAADETIFKEIEFTELPLAASVDAATQHRFYYRIGDNIQLLPATSYTGTVRVYVNHIPCRVDNLADDASSVTFPDGYEDILALEAAALILSKGGAETGAAAELKGLAREMREEMLADISRFTTNPAQVKYSDFAYEWGGM